MKMRPLVLSCSGLLLGCWLAWSAAATPENTPVPEATSSPHWAREITRFAALDADQPPPAQAIVFTGSSSVRMWATLDADFPGRPVLNRGFGGSQIRDAIFYADEIAIRYRPRQVVVYAGDNDIDAGRSPRQVEADFRALVARLRRDLPDLRITWISIKPSLARAAQLDAQREANALVREAAADLPRVDYVDVFTPMLDPDGQPRPELFLEDGLHMNARGYELWQQILVPYLE